MSSAFFNFKLKATRIATLLTIVVIIIGIITHILTSSRALGWLVGADCLVLLALIYTYYKLLLNPDIIDKLLLFNYFILALLIYFVKKLELNPDVVVWYPPLVMSSMIIGNFRIGVPTTLFSLILLNAAIFGNVSFHSLVSLNLSTLGASFFGSIIIKELQKYAKENERLKEQLLHLANHDLLTKLPNRRYFLQECQKMIALAERKKEPLTLLYLDLDHFKKINDTYGHQKGDEVLMQFADILRDNTRAYDLKARIGGEEFVVCIYGEPLENILTIAEKIRTQFEKSSLLPKKSTVSIGAYHTISPKSIQHLLHIADAALYEAKKKGRNQIVYKTD